MPKVATLRIFAMLILGVTFPGWSQATDSTQSETCKDLVNRVKQSDCMKPVAHYLDGASVVLGFGLHSSQMTLSRHDTTVARHTGILTPAPYYAFSLPKSFFGSTRLGWVVSLAYGSSFALYQSIKRGATTKSVDLGTYSTVTFASVSPSLFFAFGGRDEDPDIYTRVGLGLGLGMAGARGTAYYTETPGACADAATQYKDGLASEATLKSICPLESFQHFDMGGSSHLFLDWRWKFIYGALDINSLKLLRGSSLQLEPVEVALRLAYIHDL